MGKVSLFIDGTQIQAEEGMSVLDAALAADIYIPHLCSHPDLPATGGCKMCVVEIDPSITQIARERFFLDRAEELAQGRLELVAGDGWEYLRSCGKRFDVIVNDAFSGAKPLGALGNAEGAALIHGHLNEGGIYLANVRSPLEGRKAAVLAGVKDAFEQEVGEVEVVPELPENPARLANNVLIARA